MSFLFFPWIASRVTKILPALGQIFSTIHNMRFTVALTEISSFSNPGIDEKENDQVDPQNIQEMPIPGD